MLHCYSTVPSGHLAISLLPLGLSKQPPKQVAFATQADESPSKEDSSSSQLNSRRHEEEKVDISQRQDGGPDNAVHAVLKDIV